MDLKWCYNFQLDLERLAALLVRRRAVENCVIRRLDRLNHQPALFDLVASRHNHVFDGLIAALLVPEEPSVRNIGRGGDDVKADRNRDLILNCFLITLQFSLLCAIKSQSTNVLEKCSKRENFPAKSGFSFAFISF